MSAKQKRPIGRPSSYTEEIAETICERLAEGESLKRICDGDGMPRKATVFRWLETNESFRDRYARAREAQADALADEIVAIADTTEEGEETVEKGDGSIETRRGDMIQHRRLRVDARKWYASKLAPKKYGEKAEVEHKGEVSINEVRRVIVGP